MYRRIAVEVVGREHELGLLEGCLSDALESRGRLVLCSGEPGIGKTRLADELVGRAPGPGRPGGVEARRRPRWPAVLDVAAGYG